MTTEIESTTLGWILVGASISTPVILLLMTATGWWVKSRFESSQQQLRDDRLREERLEFEIREERITLYTDILEPFIGLLAGISKQGGKGRRGEPATSDKAVNSAVKRLLSLEYRRVAFKLFLFANDDVANAYNKMMQSAYSSSDAEDDDGGVRTMVAFAALLLEIRKSIGNEDTMLDSLDMIKWLLNDFDESEGRLRSVM